MKTALQNIPLKISSFFSIFSEDFFFFNLFYFLDIEKSSKNYFI